MLGKIGKDHLPKYVGGLGILYLRKQNRALLMKKLCKFVNRHDIPWVELFENHIMIMTLPLVTHPTLDHFGGKTFLN